jgi:hypothetical protein
MNTRTIDPRDRGRDKTFEQSEFEAMSLLRKRYGLRDCGPGEYDARCPAHDDHNKSLRVYRGATNGKLRFRCYAGCHYNDVRRALGLKPQGDAKRETWRPSPPAPGRRSTRQVTNYNYEDLAERFALPPSGLAPLAKLLGVSVASLLDAQAGRVLGEAMYSHKREAEVGITAWTFPMWDANPHVTGLRLRFENGDKGSWTDSIPGVFIGRRWGLPGPVAICEGPTDRAAIWDLGFDVIGRPSCNTGNSIILTMLARLRDLGDRVAGAGAARREVVIFSNLDEAKPIPGTDPVRYFYPGQEGAVQLADELTRARFPVRIITPPDGWKDFRGWKNGGATRRDVDNAIRAKRCHRLRR